MENKERSLDQIRAERIKKIETLISEGINPYPSKSHRTGIIPDILENWHTHTQSQKSLTVAGRIFSLRGQGKILFLDLKDEYGKIQIVLNKKTTQHFERVKNTIDIGDFIEANGKAFVTQKGEKSIAAKKINLLTKTLRPMPAERFAIKDDETRLRQRYLDLLLNPELRETFRQKARFWEAIRSFLVARDFLPVEVPVLENTTGGADARPFVTHHNALDIDMFLRISLELPQKKLLVGGYEKVFEIGRVFRNEGIDADHLQDYTAMEFYWAYADYTDLMKLIKPLYKELVKATTGKLKTTYQGNTINWGGPWSVVDYCDEFLKKTKINIATCTVNDLKAKAKELGLDFAKNDGKGRLIDIIYKKTVRPKLIQPTFLIHHPIDISPLAKKVLGSPHKVERVQVLAGGSELGNGWSELNDPIDQRARFEEQANLRKAGDDEAQMMDEDFVVALEHGMPPAAGFGLSERLFAVLLDKPIRETVFFPTLRPKK